MSTACPEAREQSAPVESMKNTWIRCDIGGESADGGEVRGVNDDSLPGYLHLATEELKAPNTKKRGDYRLLNERFTRYVIQGGYIRGRL